MEPMTSTRSSKAIALALAAVVLATVAAPAAAVSVGDSDLPEEAEAGTQVSASYTLTNLYQEPNWEPWTLRGQTELQNVSWTLTFIDAQGNQFDTVSYSGQTFTHSPITTQQDPPILEVRVEITGVVPPVQESELSYPEEETFDLATLTQFQGESTTGASNEIAANETHHFTAADENQADPAPGSQEARQALDEASAAIREAQDAGADTTDANETFTAAVSSYENGDFDNAVSLASSAQEDAEEAQSQLESNQQRNQLLLYGAGGLVVLALVGGAVFYFRNQGDDYDKLG